MDAQILTFDEAERRGIILSRILHESHVAFGEPDNSYEDVVRVGKEIVQVGKDDLLLVVLADNHHKVVQVLSDWECSDELLRVIAPEVLDRRKFYEYLKLTKEIKSIKSDDFYKDLLKNLKL